jgi:hypothetical protein
MSRKGRTTSVFLLVAVLVTLASSFALATEDESGEGGDESTTTTVADSGLAPAVPITDGEAAPPQADWTYRYMIPTALVLAGVIVLITAIRYFTDVVRKRYRIVEE